MKKISQQKRNRLYQIWASLDIKQYNGANKALERLAFELAARGMFKKGA